MLSIFYFSQVWENAEPWLGYASWLDALYLCETKENCFGKILLSNQIRRISKWSKILCQINQQTLKASKIFPAVWKLFK